MLKQRNLILLAIFALWLIIYLFNTRHSSWKYNTNNEIKGFDVDSRENKASMKDQLRIAQRQIKNMRRFIENTKKLPECEVIHVVVICKGQAATRDVVVLIKSILLSRKHPLHFHFISDSTAHYILNYMFKTWEIPSVTISYYSTEEIKNQKNFHQKNNIDEDNFYKLFLPSILPDNIEKVILLDPDIIFNIDMMELWIIFYMFSDEQAIGVLENQHSFNLETFKGDKNNFTVLDPDINTSVVLLNLRVLRKKGFTDKVITLIKGRNLETAFSYKDIFDVSLKKNISLLYYLPETWNFQLNGNSTTDICSRCVYSNLKILQGYSHNNLTTNENYMVLFRTLQKYFSELNGNSFTRELSACKTGSSFTKKLGSLINISDACIDFRFQQNSIFRTHLYYIEYDYKPKPNDVTIVTQMTMERLAMFDQMRKHWDGPISIALHLTEIEAYEILNFVKDSNLKMRKNIGYHIVYKEGSTALIVPAFEEKTQFIFDFPKNKQELMTQMKERQIIPFRFDSFTYGHQATDYPKWIQATAPYKVKYKAYYEPYMILPKDVPKYDTRFVGWRWDKSSHTMELDADGYEFIVLPDLFIIHKLHARTYHRTMFFTSKRYKSCVKIFKEGFLKYLAKKYGKRGEIYQKMYEKDL